MTRRILTSAYLLLVLAGVALAQSSLGALSAKLSSGTAEFEYSFTTSGSQTPFTGSGKAFVSGARYRIEGNGLDIRCDGSVRYTADAAAGEMVIEAAEGETLDFLSNPALLLSDIAGNFNVEKAVKQADGREVCELSPVNEPSVSLLKLVLVKGLPSEAELFMNDGSKVEFKVSGFSFVSDGGPWSFSPSELAKYSTVTDLR
ncbi:MAG: hypothetical protein IJ151_04925 [Bacteroidales bacterium]|nr:hypothetical protein [Bacteroidales bacterium]